MPIEIEVTNQNVMSAAARLLGAIEVQEELEKNKTQAPGFALAQALTKSVVETTRAELSTSVLRETAKLGYDISKVGRVGTIFKNSKMYLDIDLDNDAE